MKTRCFSHYDIKYQLQIHYSVEFTAENVPNYWNTNFDFLMHLQCQCPSVTCIFVP